MSHPNPSRITGVPLFSFVVVADTHVNEGEDVSSSPYATNRLANERARHVFLDIAAMDPQPKFVVHLGDIVHPVPSLPTFQDAVGCFKEIMAPVRVPVHLVPGNHDVGDKHVDWMPAEQVCESFLQTYRKAFGPDYFAFDEGNMRFIIMNSLLLNSGLPDEARQRDWMEQQLANAQGKRVFLFMHYPPFIHSTGERGNYDNVDEPGRSWLLSQMCLPQVEAAFAGHVHNFWYDRVGGAEFYMLPSTAFLRHDFSEFYRVAPSVEFGRGDVERFGYFVVDVYADGHVAHSIRTMGARAQVGARAMAQQSRSLAHPKTSTFDHVGVELRHPWTETMQITATGGVQEFGRKWARNDYPLLALWEMGSRLSKVPDIDLIENESRVRMELLARMGHRYVVTVLGVPKPALLAHNPTTFGVAAVEVNATLEGFDRQRASLRAIRAASQVQIFYSKILTDDGSHYDGKHFSHFVKSGFTLDELEIHRELIVAAHQAGEIDGVTVRIEADEPLMAAGARLKAFYDATGCRILASLKLSGPSLAVERADDRANVASVAQAMILSKASPGILYIYDTFMDVDRGYFPRHAFIDRRFNPRPAATAFTTITSLLSGASTIALTPHDDLTGATGSLAFSAGGRQFRLIFVEVAGAIEHMRQLSPQATAYDLVTGQRQSVAEQLAALKGYPASAAEDLQVLMISFQ